MMPSRGRHRSSARRAARSARGRRVVDGQDLLVGRARAGGDGRLGLRTLDGAGKGPRGSSRLLRISGDPACGVKTALGARPRKRSASLRTPHREEVTRRGRGVPLEDVAVGGLNGIGAGARVDLNRVAHQVMKSVQHSRCDQPTERQSRASHRLRAVHNHGRKGRWCVHHPTFRRRRDGDGRRDQVSSRRELLP